jgi:hypothetical protein
MYAVIYEISVYEATFEVLRASDDSHNGFHEKKESSEDARSLAVQKEDLFERFVGLLHGDYYASLQRSAIKVDTRSIPDPRSPIPDV